MEWYEVLILLLIVCVCIIIMVLVESYYEQNDVKNTTYNIMIDGLKKNKPIAFIADFHSMSSKSFHKRVLNNIKASGADTVIIGGDMIVGKSKANNQGAIRFLEELNKSYKVYFTYGNHESRMFERDIKDNSGFFDAVSHMDNVTIVNDNIEYISLGNTKVALCGITLNDEYYYKRKPKELSVETIHKKLPDMPNIDEYKIMVCHKPDFFHACADAGANLVLSGHNHGGIVRLPKIGGVISTSYKLFPKYTRGKYFYKDIMMILTAGLGMHTIPIRLFNKPEVVVLNFISIKGLKLK